MKGQLKNKKKNVKGRRDVREWKKGNATLRQRVLHLHDKLRVELPIDFQENKIGVIRFMKIDF